MSINQLLAKAMSTTSEEEAMNCLRMARKRGSSFEQGSSSNYKGQDARYWYHKAEHYYEIAKKKQEEAPSGYISHSQAQRLLELVEKSEATKRSLFQEKLKLEIKVAELENKEGLRTSFFWGGFFVGLIAALLPIVIYFS